MYANKNVYSSKQTGFRCRADREREHFLDSQYGSIGIKSVKAAQPLCTQGTAPKTPGGLTTDHTRPMASQRRS